MNFQHYLEQLDTEIKLDHFHVVLYNCNTILSPDEFPYPLQGLIKQFLFENLYCFQFREAELEVDWTLPSELQDACCWSVYHWMSSYFDFFYPYQFESEIVDLTRPESFEWIFNRTDLSCLQKLKKLLSLWKTWVFHWKNHFHNSEYADVAQLILRKTFHSWSEKWSGKTMQEHELKNWVTEEAFSPNIHIYRNPFDHSFHGRQKKRRRSSENLELL